MSSMSDTFQHFVFTRFNLRTSQWDSTKGVTKPLSDEWMEHRFDLFERYCLPAMKGQSNKNYTWVLFFDTTTSEKFRQRAEVHASELPNIRVMYLEGMGEMNPTIKRLLSESTAGYVISSRLDNDDSVSRRYIDTIQAQFKKQDFMALDFPDGYTIAISNKVRIGKRLLLNNPFVSLIERNDSPVGVLSRRHQDWKREPRVSRIRDARIWMSVIHGENSGNRFRGYSRVTVDSISEQFSLPEEVLGELRSGYQDVSQWLLISVNNFLKSILRVFTRDLKIRTGIYRAGIR